MAVDAVRGGAEGRGKLKVGDVDMNPKMRVLVVGGLYDVVVPTCHSIDDAVARLDASMRRPESARVATSAGASCTPTGSLGPSSNEMSPHSCATRWPRRRRTVDEHTPLRHTRPGAS